MHRFFLLVLSVVLVCAEAKADRHLAIEKSGQKWKLVYKEVSIEMPIEMPASMAIPIDPDVGEGMALLVDGPDEFGDPSKAVSALIEHLSYFKQFKGWLAEVEVMDRLTRQVEALEDGQALMIGKVQEEVDQACWNWLPTKEAIKVNGKLFAAILLVNLGNYYSGWVIPAPLMGIASLATLSISWGLSSKWNAILQSRVQQWTMSATEETQAVDDEESSAIKRRFGKIFELLDEVWASGYAFYGMNKEMATNRTVVALRMLDEAIQTCRFYAERPVVKQTPSGCLAGKFLHLRAFSFDIVRAGIWDWILDSEYFQDSFQDIVARYAQTNPERDFIHEFRDKVGRIDREHQGFDEKYYNPIIEKWLTVAPQHLTVLQ